MVIILNNNPLLSLEQCDKQCSPKNMSHKLALNFLDSLKKNLKVQKTLRLNISLVETLKIIKAITW